MYCVVVKELICVIQILCYVCKCFRTYSKTCAKWPPSKRPKSVFNTNYRLMQVKYCRMLQGEHSAILSTFINGYRLSLRSLFYLFLSGCFTQVLLYLSQCMRLRHLQVNLCCSQTQSWDIVEGSGQNRGLSLNWLAAHAYLIHKC